MRFKEAQADPGNNSQAFSMFSRALQKRPRITSLGVARAPKSYLCIRAVSGGGKRAEMRMFGLAERTNAAGPSAAFSKRQAAGDQIAASYLRARSRSFFLTGRKSHPVSPLVSSPNRLSRRSPLYQPLVQPSR